MSADFFDNPADFQHRVLPLLMQNECINCVMISVTQLLVDGRPNSFTGPPLLMSVEDDAGQVIAGVFQTPPHGLQVTPFNDERIAGAIADALIDHGWRGDHLFGSLPAVRLLARQLEARWGVTFHKTFSMAVYQLDRVADVPSAPGFLRCATRDDLPLLTSWIESFGQEVGEPNRDAATTAQRAIDDCRLHVWIGAETNQPVTMCAWTGKTPSSVRISLVYTPRAQRGHGFATTAVAELSRRMLNAGSRYCFLFTDLANPTSNGIYQKIGYQRVADFEQLKSS